VIPKNIIFTVDVSSSMEGERLVQVKEAILEFLKLLNPQDYFNIITFGTFVNQFEEDLVPASFMNVDAAKDYVFQLYALGLTNIDEALTTSLNQTYQEDTSNNLIFLTDGKPTWGETNTEIILNNVESLNTEDVRIFSFGVGEEISKSFLYDLSAENHGYVKYITSDDSIALVVNEHFVRISKPVLKNVQLDFGDLQSLDQYPKNIPDLFWGSQILNVGLYNNSGSFPVTLSGEMSSESFEHVKVINFPDTIGGHRFVPRLWAKAKIDHLLGMIETFGENDELVNQVIELSLRFGILTPYTAFYSDPDDDDPDDDATALDRDKQYAPDEFFLEQNFPNPFNPITTIRYQLPTGSENYDVRIKIYDSLGRLVAVLVSKVQQPGMYTITWDSRDFNGVLAPSGVYYYRIDAGDFTQTRKMVLIR